MPAEPKASERPRRGRMLAASLLLSVVALALTCGLAEVGFRLAGYTPLYDVYSKPSLFWVHDDELGWAHEPGASGVYVGPRPFPIEFETPVRINSDGLRGPELGPKRPDDYRVLVLGDSVVAGFEVPYAETFTALMEERLQRRLGVPVRVVNAGVRGYGTDQELLYYSERGRALEPDLVLLVFSTNDFDNNVTLHRMRRPFGKGGFAVQPDGRLQRVGVPVPRYPLCSAWVLDAAYEPRRVDGALNRLACFVQTRAADRSALFTFLSQALGRMPGLVHFLKDLSYPGAPSIGPSSRSPVRTAGMPGLAAAEAGGAALQGELSSALLSELASRVRADGSDFIVLIRTPNLQRLADPERLLREIDFRQVGVPRHLEFRMLRFKNDAHYNARGHQVLAAGLLPVVEAYARRARPALGPGPGPGRVPGRITSRDLVRP
jgi:lysophospholipase L1-like esterase